MEISGFISRIRAIQENMYDGWKPTIEELIELSCPQGSGLHLPTEQELEMMIEGINNGLDAIGKAYFYFDGEIYRRRKEH